MIIGKSILVCNSYVTLKKVFMVIFLEIVEPPASNKMRFRYECEGRSAGAIQGASSTPQHRTCPTIRLVGYKVTPTGNYQT